jgi:hypothetical protein
MVFDFNTPNSGYDLAGMQTSFGRLGERIKVGSHRISTRLQSVVGGEVQNWHASLAAMHKATWG